MEGLRKEQGEKKSVGIFFATSENQIRSLCYETSFTDVRNVLSEFLCQRHFCILKQLRLQVLTTARVA
jgi:hypothetical protein